MRSQQTEHRPSLPHTQRSLRGMVNVRSLKEAESTLISLLQINQTGCLILLFQFIRPWEEKKNKERVETLTCGLGRGSQEHPKSECVTETVGVTYANMIKCNYMEKPPCFYQRTSFSHCLRNERQEVVDVYNLFMCYYKPKGIVRLIQSLHGEKV